MDRLYFNRFRANGLKSLEHTLVVLHRDATAPIPEVAPAEVNTTAAFVESGRRGEDECAAYLVSCLDDLPASPVV